MGNANCTNCSQCRGDDGEHAEILTVDNKVSKQSILNLPFTVRNHKTNIRSSGK